MTAGRKLDSQSLPSLITRYCRRVSQWTLPWARALPIAATALGVVAACLFLAGHTASAVVPEFKTKASLIFKIGKFVRWPADAFTSADGTFRVCIVGRYDFGDGIDSLGGKTLQGRPIAVARLSDLQQPATECQIVFISASERDRVSQFLVAIAQSPVLTISDIEGFASAGGMVGFAATANKVHFEINAAASRRARLQIGAQLLQLATLIEDQRTDIAP